MKAKGDRVVLSSGRKFYAYAGILGLGELDKPGHWTLTYGYDGRVDFPEQAEEWQEEADEKPFTPEERREIAEAMIARWREWGGL